ncbi:MAG: RNA polymerase sigma factor [Phycisphaerae bacterium]|nr:RNA polymerase sigma factor [Phycisphaerae bacterium]
MSASWPCKIDPQSAVERARGDRDAFAELYRRHYPLVFRYCAHRLFDRHAAEDLTADVFLKAVEHLDRFEGDEPALRAWLYRIATNRINEHLRTNGRRGRPVSQIGLVNDPVAPYRGDAAERIELGRTLAARILALPPRQQALIVLHYFERLKLVEIADILESSPATIRSQLARALAKLRNSFPSSGKAT